MSYCDLLTRMMQKDTDAFLELTDRYGWPLYSEIRRKHPNKAEADRIYNETMQYFYHCLQNAACADPVEALLLAFSDQIAEKLDHSDEIFMNTEQEWNMNPPYIQLDQTKADLYVAVSKKKRNTWFRLGILFVLMGFATVVWLGLGLMMEAGKIPYYDIGYSWFLDMVSCWI